MNDSDRQPPLEPAVAAEVKALLAATPTGSDITIPTGAEIGALLEYFLPRLLAQKYPRWSGESLDGISALRATKTAANALLIVGTAILISDQTLTPFLVEIEVAASGESIKAYRVCVGEPGNGALGVSGPPCNSKQAARYRDHLLARLLSVEVSWVFDVSAREP
jgi:hypothetical protein